MNDKRCVNCDNFYLSQNICLEDHSICYDNGKCLHENCEKFRWGTWSADCEEAMVTNDADTQH